MGHSQRSGVYTGIGLVLCVSVGLAACDQQATEQYLGEPLLQLQGTATIAVETGGQAVTPALCFSRRAPYRRPASFGVLPAEAREALETSFLASDEYDELASEAAIWMPHGEKEIIEVETVGEFPAEFRIAAYVPPSDDFLQPAFEGEPPLAEGRLCAVRSEHPHVVHRSVFVNSDSLLERSDEAQTLYRAWLDTDTDAFYLETWRCPADASDCEMTSEGDVAVQRNAFGIFVEAEAEPILVYLAEAAAPGSYTAWKYNAHDGLSAGFHLFEGLPLDLALPRDRKGAKDCGMVRPNAFAEILAKFPDRATSFATQGGLALTNIETDPVLNEAFQRRVAELSMEHCEPPPYTPISMNASIALKFRAAGPTLSPPMRRVAQQQTP